MADESRRLIKGLMARFVRLTAIRDAGNNMGKVDCTQQVDVEDIGVPKITDSSQIQSLLLQK